MGVSFNDSGFRSSLGHRRAQRSGAEHEQLVDVALDRLRDDRVLQWHPTGPKVKFLKNGTIVTVGDGPPDRLIAMNNIGIWMEVKVWGNKNRCTYRERLHQYMTMVNFAAVGFKAAYLVRWHRLPEWRLHPLAQIEKVLDGGGRHGFGLVFERDSGIHVPESAWEVPDLRCGLEALCLG